MSKVLAWVKANVAIVVLSAIALLVLPAGFIGSGIWNKNIREAREKAVNADLRKITENKSFRYTGLQLSPDRPALDHSAPPNPRVTEFFRELREKQGAQLKSVVERAAQHNQRGHKPLVEGLLPGPMTTPAGADPIRAYEMAGHIVAGEGGGTSIYERLLQEIDAGGPAPAAQVGRVLQDLSAREEERIRAKGLANDTLSDAEKKEIADKLVNQRIGEYRKRAEQVSVYADLGVFRGGSPTILEQRPSVTPSLSDVFKWQHDIWVVEDLLAAVRLANTDSSGRPQRVPEAVVKRIVSLSIDPIPDYEVPGEGETVDPGPDPSSGLITGDPSASITGRWGWGANQLYDLRTARLEVVVAMDRLPVLLNAISQTNFMTVVDLDLSPVETWEDLDRGYFYGEDYVVRAKLEIETIWLRAWTKQYMPREVRLILGIPDDPPPG